MEVSGPEPEGDGCTAETLQAASASLFQRVWRAVLGQGRPKPPAKELDETHDFVKKVTGVKGFCRNREAVVIDVCGGHGLIALLMLIYNRAHTAVVLDIAKPVTFQITCERVVAAGLLVPDRVPRFVQARLQDQLGPLIDEYLEQGRQVLIVGCHTCSHLADEIIDIFLARQSKDIRLALCACCHSTRGDAGVSKHIAKSLGVSLAAVQNLKRMGRLEQCGFEVRWRELNPDITPENITLVAWPRSLRGNDDSKASSAARDAKLALAYTRAHAVAENNSTTALASL